MTLLAHWVRNGVIAWCGVLLGVFLLLELPSRDVFGVWPWPSLSWFVWNSIHWWHAIAFLVFLFMLALLGHFEWHWAAKWLIAVAVATGVMVLARVIVG